MNDALTLARELAHPQTLVVASHFSAQLHQLRGELLAAQERATEVVALAGEYGLDLWRGIGSIDSGWAEFELGELIMRAEAGAADASAKAGASFAEGLRIAQKQRAKSWELRILTSLEHLHQKKSSRRETRHALARIYSEFTEGHETTDLKNARTLLTGLSRA